MEIKYALPDKIVTNEELAALYEGWTAEKILSKTGIASRHVVVEDETALDLAEKAANKLFAEGGVSASEVDFVLLCTQSPDYKLPSSACILQDRLGIPTTAGALDFDLGCSGFVYGLSLAKGLVVGGMAKKVLLVTAETYTKYIHPMDKSVRTIFGDGAAATLVDEAAANSIGAFAFGTDGSGADKLIVKTGGSRFPFEPNAEEVADESGNKRTANNVFMAGPDIFNFTLDIVPKTMDAVCAKNGCTRDDIDLFVFHQANKFMLDTIRKVNLIPRAKFYIDLEDTGNTVSSTIPIALVRAQEKGVLHPGMKVMIMGFGVGLSWAPQSLTFDIIFTVGGDVLGAPQEMVGADPRAARKKRKEDKMEMNEKLEALADILDQDAGSLNENTQLDTIGWDSMGMLSVIALAKQNGKTITGAQIREFTTVGDILNAAF